MAKKTKPKALCKEPDVASTTLARRLYKKHPELWPTENAANCAVRRLRGAHGAYNRECVKKLTSKRTKEEAKACGKWGALLPTPDPADFETHFLPAKVKRWLVCSDLHVPYHDLTAMVKMLAFAKREKVDGVLILGDGIDAYQLSSFQKDPRKRSIVKEVDAWGQVLDTFRKLVGKDGSIIWKGGNHEYRLERYLMAKAPELFGTPWLNWETMCELKRRGVQWIPSGHPIQHGQLLVVHGHEWGARFSSPVNPARGAFLRAHECTLEGHGHRTSHHTERTVFGREISCWSIGCLCTLTPEYRPLGNKWNHGFGILHAGHDWTFHNHRIIKGEIT
jgi:predicted phosphodiesterase